MKLLKFNSLVLLTFLLGTYGYPQVNVKRIHRHSIEITISNDLSDTVYMVNPLTYSTLHKDGEIILDEPLLKVNDSSIIIFGNIRKDKINLYNYTTYKIISLAPGTGYQISLLMYLPRRIRKQFRKKRVGFKFLIKSGDTYVEKISYYED